MSPPPNDVQFRAMADSFIHLANEHSDSTPHDQVSASLSYAASRYAAFVAFTRANSQAHFAAGTEEAVRFFVGQFETMLRENLADHEANFNRYRGQ